MGKEAPYTVTIYVAAPGTPLKSGGTSAAGHMYLAVAHDGETRSFGFAPARHGASSGPGAVTGRDVDEYQNPFYSRTMEISKEQYDKILTYGANAAKHGFNMEYNGFSNSCIDFTWGRSTMPASTGKPNPGRTSPSKVRSSHLITSTKSKAFQSRFLAASSTPSMKTRCQSGRCCSA